MSKIAIPSLRHYQEKLDYDIKDSISKGHTGICAVSPTGSGKSKTMGFMCMEFVGNGNQVVFVVHRQELVKQLSMMLCEYQLPHQIIAAGHTASEAKSQQFQTFGRSFIDPFSDAIYVCSVQTLASRLGKIKINPDVLFFDEGHHVSESSLWGKVREHYQNALALLFTASPERLDGKGLGVGHGGYCTDIVMGPYVDDLIDEGYLSDYVAFVPPEPINVTGMRETKTGGMSAKVADEFYQSKGQKVCADLIDHYSKHCPHKPMVAYAANVRASEDMAEQFSSQGFKAIAINGNTNQSVRNKALSGLASGEYEVVCNADLISEGFDVPSLFAVGLCRPTQSLGLHIQQIGRPLRTHPDKKVSYIFDCVGNIQNLEHFPCTRRDWSLEGKKGRKKTEKEVAIKVRTCPTCFATHRFAKQCPDCGYVYTFQENEIQRVQMELKAVTPEELKRMRDEQRNAVRLDQNAGIRAAQTAAELAALDAKLGMKKGASAHKKHAIEEKKKAVKRMGDAFKYYKEHVAWGDPSVFGAIMQSAFNVSEKDASKYGATRINRLCDEMRELAQLRSSEVEQPYSSLNYKLAFWGDNKLEF